MGSNIGYENGQWQEREVRFVIEEGSGDVFVGLKYWREIGGEWSEAEIFSGSLHDSGEFFPLISMDSSSVLWSQKVEFPPHTSKRD